MKNADENNDKEKICRLCAGVQQCPIRLFTNSSSALDKLVDQVLNYIGMNLVDDGSMPNWICASCHLEAESAEKFLENVKTGQHKLEQLMTHTKNMRVGEDLEEQPIDVDNFVLKSSHEPNEGILKRQMKRKAQTETVKAHKQNVLKSNVNRKTCFLGTRSRCLARDREAAVDIEVPTNIAFGEDLLSSSLISDTRETNLSLLNPREPFAELRAADGAPLAAVIVVDTRTGSNAHSTIPKIRLVCEFCKEVFLNRDFRKHLRTHNNCAYECTECLENYRSKNELNHHQKKTGHQGMGIIENLAESDVKKEITTAASNQKAISTENNGCKTTADTTINITVDDDGHITSIGSDMIASRKEMCEAIAKSKTLCRDITSFKMDEKQQAISYTCLQCEKGFTSHYAVLRHYNQVHIGARIYKCEQCPASFKHQTNFAYHAAKHTGYRKFKCELCAKAFRQKCELKLHMRTHTGDKPFKCEFCTKAFAHRSNMVTHIRLHTGIFPFKCETCGSLFNSSSHWKAHKAGHLKQELQKLQMNNNDKSKPATINQKVATILSEPSKSVLRPKRAIIETIEILPSTTILAIQKPPQNVPKPQLPVQSSPIVVEPPVIAAALYKFQCSQCFQHFKLKSALTKHMRTHSNEKPYKCPHCPRTFSDPSNFKRHKVLHKTASEQIQNVSSQLNQQVHHERKHQNFSPTHSVTSDPDPDGVEANERVELIPMDNSSSEIGDDSSFLNMIGRAGSSPAALSDICATTAVKSSSKVVCISYPDPTNPNDNNVTTFFVPN